MTAEYPRQRPANGDTPQPEMQIVPATPEKDVVPDADQIPPAVRQQIIDDITKQEEEEREREERINEIIRKRKES